MEQNYKDSQLSRAEQFEAEEFTTWLEAGRAANEEARARSGQYVKEHEPEVFENTAELIELGNKRRQDLIRRYIHG